MTRRSPGAAPSPVATVAAALAAAGVAVGSTALPATAAFERPPLFPESAAMAGVLATGPDGVWGNPAGAVLPRVAGGGILQSAAARPFDLTELTENQLAASVAGSQGAAGMGARRFGSQVYAEKEVRIVVSGSPVPGIAVGAAARGLSVCGAFDPIRSFALDVGFRARADSSTVVAALAEAVLGEIPGDPRGELRRTAFGLARRLAGTAVLRLELQRQGSGPLAAALGCSWTPWPALTLRAGAREDPRSLSWGFTVRNGALGLSGSAAHGPLGRTLRIGLQAARQERASNLHERLKARPRRAE